MVKAFELITLFNKRDMSSERNSKECLSFGEFDMGINRGQKFCYGRGIFEPQTFRSANEQLVILRRITALILDDSQNNSLVVATPVFQDFEGSTVHSWAHGLNQIQASIVVRLRERFIAQEETSSKS